MSPHHNIDAVVIKMYNAKDADRVVHFIASDGSRMVAMAKGIKKTNSRKAHAIDLLNQVSVKLIKGKGELGIITEAKLTRDCTQFKADYSGLMFLQAV
jgi:DNA repair protein RecO (recombination protein O)